MTPQAFKAWRKRHGITQQTAATLLGVSRQTIVEWENGGTPINPIAHNATTFFDLVPEKERAALITLASPKI